MFNDEYLTTLTLKLRPLLPRWGLSEGAEIGLLTVSENATFLVSDKMAQRKIVLRVHRPNYSSAVEIHSELMWLNALHARGDINIAVPLVLDDGTCIASLIDGETVTTSWDSPLLRAANLIPVAISPAGTMPWDGLRENCTGTAKAG